MKTLALSVCLFCAASAAAQTPAWKQRYAGADATGPGVLALWQFLPGQETQDNSGKGHVLTLRGDARFADDGPVEGGRCLESFATDPKNEKAQGAVVAHHPGLTPAGAFTLELWIKPKPGFEQQKNMTLLDKMYINYKHPNPTAECQRDYMLSLDRTGDGSHVLAMFLGHGETMSRYASSPLVLKAGEWRHVTFTYNGAGQGRFFLDGKDAGRTEHKGCGPVVGGKYSLALGDRSGSSYIGFHGFLAQVRLVNGISPAFAGRLSLRVAGGRRVFERFEDGARLKAAIVNDGCPSESRHRQ